MTPGLLFEPPYGADWLQPYWEGVRQGELRLPRCSVCGDWQWYPDPAGPGCEGADLVWQKISPEATVFTFTRVERPLLPDVTQPYVTGLVCPVDAPDCRVATRLVSPSDKFSIGAPARLAFYRQGDTVLPYYIVEVTK